MRLATVEPDEAGLERIELIWRALEHRSRPSYFLTWGWIENWLAMLPPDQRPVLGVLRDHDRIAGALFLGRQSLVRHRVVPSRALYANATGVTGYDELCIEHNQILGDPISIRQLIEVLPDDWDELCLPGFDARVLGEVPDGHRVVVEREVAAPFVDLAQVRAAGDYLALLSANTRAQIRRARRRVARDDRGRESARDGGLVLDVATTTSEALAIFDELVALHAASWQTRGEPGAFADPWFEQFHRRLIERRFAHGEIWLARLRAGRRTMGCLYNFVIGDRVLFYQSGLAHDDDPVVKPGLLCHAAAIERCARDGLAVYDLLGGDARYKASLATGATRLAWVRVQRPRLRFAIEDRVRQWKHALVEAWS
ncbi:MAG TPA: GNAT family N-acetyltransferase [Kofleriaceae bacterium]|nr:GNAT family N-acetyltransferase [Kofleriaceae bacterium]